MVESLKVGFIGLGMMGKPMAKNLLKAGFALTVHNRSRASVEELAAAGANAAESPEEVARSSDFIITCLPGPVDVERVCLGTSGVLAGVKPGSVLIEMSTVDPGTHRRIAAAASERQVDYLDAPISGGTTGAVEGTLTIMIGGDATVIARVEPVLRAMGQRIYHLGPVGSGAIVKLINNMAGAINLAGVVEALVLGVKAGIDPSLLYEVMSNSSGSSRMLAAGMPDVLARQFDPGFSIDLLHKDVNLAIDLGRALKVRLLAGSLAGQVLQEARCAGLGSRSIFAEIIPLERNAGVEVKG